MTLGNIVDSNGPLVLPNFPPGHTFVVTSNLMQILTARGLLCGHVCHRLEGIPSIIDRRCLYIVHRAALQLNPYLVQLRDVFLAKYFTVS